MALGACPVCTRSRPEKRALHETFTEDQRSICGRKFGYEHMSRTRYYTLRALTETLTNTTTLNFYSLLSLSPTQLSSLARELTGMLLYRNACTSAACSCAGVYVPQPCICSILAFAPDDPEHSRSHLLHTPTYVTKPNRQRIDILPSPHRAWFPAIATLPQYPSPFRAQRCNLKTHSLTSQTL